MPDPAPVAVNLTPTLLDIAPIAVKSVVPIETIVYCCPITKDPAVAVLRTMTTELKKEVELPSNVVSAFSVVVL